MSCSAPTPPARPDRLPGVPDLGEIEHLVRRAIDERRTDLLTTVGFGEFSLAIRWSLDDGTDMVVKRVPPFSTAAAAERYCDLTRAYIDALEAVDVACVRTELEMFERPDGSVVVFHCQPLLAPEQLVSNILRAAGPDPDHPVVSAVVAATGRAVRPRVAFDPQCSNWAWTDERVWYLDLSTPMLLDDADDLQFEQDGLALEYPAIVRPILDREARKYLPMYADLDFVLTDLVSLLHREHLERWCQPFIEVIERQHGISVSAEQAEKNFRADLRIFPFLHALKKTQRFWLQHTGRKYESLLSTTSSYGA